MSTAARPRLAEHVAARHHVVGGATRVILCDERDGSLVELGWREWTLLRSADGTRDVVGLVRAAKNEGAHVTLDAATGFFAELAAAGLVHDARATSETTAASPMDPDEDHTPAGVPEPAAPDRALDVLPGFGLHCDGHGGCCSIYPSVYFSEPETARARAAMPEVLEGGAQPERVFLPVHGATPRGLHAVACVDGACGYLQVDGLCGIHARAGSMAKPAGCRLYPASYVDDGECVRVSVATECPCVLASVGRPGGESLVAPGARTQADLEPAAYVFRLPATIQIAERVTVSREAYVRWSREVLALPEFDDVPAAMWRLADGLETARDATTAAQYDPRGISPVELYPWLEALWRAASVRAREHDRFRAERDRARVATRWLVGAAEALLDTAACTRVLGLAAEHTAAEAFALRAAVHGHQLPGARPVSHALRERAVRAVVAREIPAAAARAGLALDEVARDPWCRQPLALVNALLRGHGIARYADELLR